MDPRNLGERLEATAWLDAVIDPVARAAASVLPRGPLKDGLHGVWLGHPLHPLLTDLPIGFWTSAWVLDLVGGRKSAKAAEKLMAFGVVSALPTAAAGLADWSELNTPERRSGAVHAAANLFATVLYATSYLARRRGRRGRGIALGMVGAAAATAGGFLGGHLSFRRAAGVNHITDAAVCSHLGGPLDEGVRDAWWRDGSTSGAPPADAVNPARPAWVDHPTAGTTATPSGVGRVSGRRGRRPRAAWRRRPVDLRRPGAASSGRQRGDHDQSDDEKHERRGEKHVHALPRRPVPSSNGRARRRAGDGRGPLAGGDRC